LQSAGNGTLGPGEVRSLRRGWLRLAAGLCYAAGGGSAGSTTDRPPGSAASPGPTDAGAAAAFPSVDDTRALLSFVGDGPSAAMVEDVMRLLCELLQPESPCQARCTACKLRGQVGWVRNGLLARQMPALPARAAAAPLPCQCTA
jgi:hypothetical protein